MRSPRAAGAGARRWLGAVATSAALVLAPAQLASAHQPGGAGDDQSEPVSFADQEVVQLDANASGRLWDSGLEYHQSAADSVTATNAAVAYAACDGCRAVSLSFQVVVADGAPTTLALGNVAVATTEDCTGCEAVAVAYQLVVASGDRLRLTDRGRAGLADLRRHLRRLARSDLSPSDIQAQAADLMSQVSATLSQELRAKLRVRCDREVDEGRPVGHDRSQVTDGLDGHGTATGRGA
ncbi:hypothetical protein ACFUC1_06610 [Pedococcus sp. NPDC057267]|uniref:hypothetical protein n=1 Tax=Pedococcus sp. NPDC057267 TaxID=3346077 RepID=UPI00363A6EC1